MLYLKPTLGIKSKVETITKDRIENGQSLKVSTRIISILSTRIVRRNNISQVSRWTLKKEESTLR